MDINHFLDKLQSDEAQKSRSLIAWIALIVSMLISMFLLQSTPSISLEVLIVVVPVFFTLFMLIHVFLTIVFQLIDFLSRKFIELIRG